MNEVAIIKINDSETKSLIAAEILEDLPQWFGLPERTKEYIEEVYHLPMWAAFDKNHAVGFITLKESSQYTAEIHCMGVKRVFQRAGIGHRLLQELELEARRNYVFLQVKTVAKGHYSSYDQTIAFYKKVGFLEVEVFPRGYK